MDNTLTPKIYHSFTFDRYTSKIKCTFRRNNLTLSDFTLTSADDYSYTETCEANGCSVTYNIRVNGKYPNRLFNKKYPPEISVNGNAELMGTSLAVFMPLKNLNTHDGVGTRKEEIFFNDKDVSITATFDLSNNAILKATRQKMKRR